MTKEITVKGIEFKVENYGSIVHVFNKTEDVIIEHHFPSKHYRNPDHFVGHIIATQISE